MPEQPRLLAGTYPLHERTLPLLRGVEETFQKNRLRQRVQRGEFAGIVHGVKLRVRRLPRGAAADALAGVALQLHVRKIREHPPQEGNEPLSVQRPAPKVLFARKIVYAAAVHHDGRGVLGKISDEVQSVGRLASRGNGEHTAVPDVGGDGFTVFRGYRPEGAEQRAVQVGIQNGFFSFHAKLRFSQENTVSHYMTAFRENQ